MFWKSLYLRNYSKLRHFYLFICNSKTIALAAMMRPIYFLVCHFWLGHCKNIRSTLYVMYMYINLPLNTLFEDGELKKYFWLPEKTSSTTLSHSNVMVRGGYSYGVHCIVLVETQVVKVPSQIRSVQQVQYVLQRLRRVEQLSRDVLRKAQV